MVPLDGAPPTTPFTNNTGGAVPVLATVNRKVCPGTSTTEDGVITTTEVPQPHNIAKHKAPKTIAAYRMLQSSIVGLPVADFEVHKCKNQSSDGRFPFTRNLSRRLDSASFGGSAVATLLSPASLRFLLLKLRLFL